MLVICAFFQEISSMYKKLAIKFVKYNFYVGMVVFFVSFTLTILDYVLGLNLGLYPR